MAEKLAVAGGFLKRELCGSKPTPDVTAAPGFACQAHGKRASVSALAAESGPRGRPGSRAVR